MRNVIVVSVVLLAGCSSEVKLPGVGARYTPPRGFSLVSQSAGPPPRAVFGRGLSIARFAEPLPPGDADAVAAALPALADLGPGWTVRSVRAGTLPLGPVVRVSLARADGERMLCYVAKRSNGFLLLALDEPASATGSTEAEVEASLSTLRASP